MGLEIGLPDWEVRAEERSAYVWVLQGQHISGASFELTTSDPDPANRARTEALDIEANLPTSRLV
jgi:hypothetical protein